MGEILSEPPQTGAGRAAPGTAPAVPPTLRTWTVIARVRSERGAAVTRDEPADGISSAHDQLAEQIRRRRKHAGLSQSQLAAMIGYSPQYVSLAERPNKGLASAAVVSAIDNALDAGGALLRLRDQAESEQHARRHPNATAGPSGQPPDDDHLAGLVADAASRVVRMLNDDGGLVVSRRTMVRGMLVHSAVAGGLLGAGGLTGRWVSSRRTLDPRAVAELATITAAHERLYYTMDPMFLLDAVLPHLQVGVGLLSQPLAQSAHYRALAGSVAESALLAARISFFDLGDVELAKDCFTLASQAVEASDDHALGAAIRAHQAFVPGFAGNVSAARALLEDANVQARFGPSPRLRSWIHCVSAEISARTGNATDSVHQIREAEQALAGSGEDPRWLDYYDEARWAGFAGQVYLLAGKHSQAVAHLRLALDQLGDNGHKQRPVLLMDLACAQAYVDAAEASATAHQAFDALVVTPYDAATSRFPQLVSILSSTPYAAEVVERIRTLPMTPSRR
jgi:transcriptional regulator with XRE-family HTH domain